MAYTEEELKKELETKEYEYGFYTDIESDTLPKGLNEDIVRAISKKKEEPEWMTAWRLEAFAQWKKMEEPEWANVHYEKPNFQDISYYSAPNKKPKYDSLDEVDPELLDTFKKLGISIDEQKNLAGVAVDIVMDSVSVATTFKKTLAEKGIIFCSISEAIQEHPELVKKYIGSVVPAKTISMQRLTRLFSLMVVSVTSLRELNALWSFLLISESIRQERVSSRERL
jgi:Fe-S cluster assembly protein SufB